MCINFSAVHKTGPEIFDILVEICRKKIIFHGVSGPLKAQKCHVFWIVGKKLVSRPPWFFGFELEVWFFTPRFGSFLQFWHFLGPCCESDPKTTRVWWFWRCFFKYAPWCLTCPLIFTLCVASCSNFCGHCRIYQRVVLFLPGGMVQPFSKTRMHHGAFFSPSEPYVNN